MRNARARLPIGMTLLVAAAAPAAGQSDDAAGIATALRPAVRVTNRPDVTFEITDRMRHYHVPGISIAVVEGDRVVWARGYGVREFGGPVPVDTSTLFLAGSISKPVFATGALALVERGELTLDTDINEYLRTWRLPDNEWTATEKVTLRRLLSHQAGLTVWGFPGYELTAPVPTVAQILDGADPANTDAVRSDTTPGARWLYSGGGYTIAQLMTTDVTGEPFPALMHRLVLEPADMPHSTYANPPPSPYAAFTATGHEETDTPVPGGYHVYPEMAAAGLWTTASDLARWAISVARAYRGQDGEIISPAMAEQMLTRQVQVLPPYGSATNPAWWGLGVQLRGEADSLQFAHGGRDEGFVAQLVMYPERQRGLVIMMNGVNGGLMGEVLRAFDAMYGLRTAPRVEKTLVELSDAQLDRVAGEYLLTQGQDSVTVTVTRRGDALWMKTSQNEAPEVRLWPEAEDAFFEMENGVGTRFLFPSGQPGAPAITLVRQQGNRTFTARRIGADGG